MTQKLTCTIPSSVYSYDIEISNGSFHSQATYLKPLAAKFAIITNDTLAPLYGKKLQQALGPDAHLFTIPDGEQYKSREIKEQLEDQLFQKGLGRDTCIIALGGGVVTDLGGYVAATYCRGLPLVLMPTSLLAMVDAAIGGKTGVNVPYGKNLIGSIYQPKKVVIDPAVLSSLPKKELVNGVVEMIKHGLIADLHYFEYMEKHVDDILVLNPAMLEKAIYESCRIKKEIVEQDEKEHGKRRLLNFGHTIGHALETLTKYSISHGEAVAIGLLVESYLSVQLKELEENVLKRIHQIIRAYGVPLKLPKQLPVSDLLHVMELDKKSSKGVPRFVVIQDIGSPIPYDSHFCTSINASLIKKALEWMNHDLLSH
jgi:3-dehydroquinate synthase